MTEVLSKELWKRVTDLTQYMLKEKGLHYEFNPPKNDGSYVKTGPSGTSVRNHKM